jgi:opacity protein-like surface antigen
MRIRIAAATAAILLGAPAVAAAQDAATPSGAYGGLGYAYHDYDGANLNALQGRLGYRFTPNLAVEGEAGFGVGHDTSNVAGVSARTKLDYQGAVYGVGLLPVSPKLDLFGRLGYGATRVKTRLDAGGGVTASDHDTIHSWNYGGGVQYHFDDKNGLRAEYTRADAIHNDPDANVWSLGYVRRF